jgi:hypothetical protein
MRPRTPEVIEALKQHANGRARAMRSNKLAAKAGIPLRIVSNALNWLVVDNKHPQVFREREARVTWYKYWWDEGAS